MVELQPLPASRPSRYVRGGSRPLVVSPGWAGVHRGTRRTRRGRPPTSGSKVSCTSPLSATWINEESVRVYQVLHTGLGASLKWLTILRLTGDGTKTDPPQEGDLLDAEKILVTGVHGQNRLSDREDAGRRQRGLGRGAPARSPRTATTSSPPASHLSRWTCPTGDLSSLPDDFTYVFHAAVDPGADDWQRCLERDAHNSGELLYHCRGAKGFVLCSTGSLYDYQGHRPLREATPRGSLRQLQLVQDRRRSSVNLDLQRLGIPITIIRIFSTYGPHGGAPDDRLDIVGGQTNSALPGRAQQLQPDIRGRLRGAGIRAMEVGASPALTVNWAGSETVSVEDYCAYMGRLVGGDRNSYSPQARSPLWPDVTLCTRCWDGPRCSWKDGFRRMIPGPPPRTRTRSHCDSTTREVQR